MSDKPGLAVILALFILFLVLCSRFPYVSDDWVWGGTDRLSAFIDSFTNPENNFHAYNNGRYLGNFLGFVSANHEAFRNVVSAFILSSICWLCGRLSQIEDRYFPVQLIIAAILLISCPRNMFRQSIAWSSAFMIYIVSSALLLLCFFLLRFFGNGKPNALFFIIPFLTAFFVENISIGNVLFIAARIAYYRLVRKESVGINEWLYLAASLSGLCLMFSDDGYHVILGPQEDAVYWSAQTSSAGAMIGTALLTFRDRIADLLVFDYPVLCIFGAVQLVLFAAASGTTGKKLRASSVPAFSGFCISLIVVINALNPNWIPDNDWTQWGKALLALCFLLCFPITILLSDRSRDCKEQLLSVWLLIIFISAPLAVASPLSSRVFFPAYTVTILFYLMLVNENIRNLKKTVQIDIPGLRKGILTLCILTFLCCWGHWFSVYSIIHHYDKERLKYVDAQIDAGIWPGLLPRLPYEDYLIVSYPYDVWINHFQKFYGIRPDMKLNICSFEEWMQEVGKDNFLQ